MSRPRKPASSGRGVTRVVVYYVVLAVVIVLLGRQFPMVRDVVEGGRLQELAGADVLGSNQAPSVAAGAGEFGVALLGTLSMLGALAIMIPVTWVYMITRRHRGYHESVVHTLLILPVAVTGIVIIVQNSVALAFSLAGIVAAVRFRTTLEDTKDAVYVFLAIGVGLASGVQALGLAIVLSLVFNGVILVLWRTSFGNIYADQNTRAGPLGLGDVLAGPASAHTALQVGDPAVLDAAAPADLAEIADRMVRIERHLSGERTKKKTKRVNTLLILHAGEAEAAQNFMAELLEELATRWKFIEATADEGGQVLLQYIARFDGAGVQGAVMDRIRDAPEGLFAAAELRSLKGLKPRS
jgi:Domain of unknown function (DUF4956)